MTVLGSASSGAAVPDESFDIGAARSEDRRLMVWHTGARIFEVVAGSGRRRFVMLVRCPYCPDLHSMSAYELKPTFRRRAMCGLGYVVVHTHAEQVVAA